jgi:hypothetical protein
MKLGKLSVLATFGSAAWIVASALDWKWASVAIILASTASAIVGLERAARQEPEPGDRLFALWPPGLLGGWLTIASALNVLNVLTAKAAIGPDNATAAASRALSSSLRWSSHSRPAHALGGLSPANLLGASGRLCRRKREPPLGRLGRTRWRLRARRHRGLHPGRRWGMAEPSCRIGVLIKLDVGAQATLEAPARVKSSKTLNQRSFSCQFTLKTSPPDVTNRG